MEVDGWQLMPAVTPAAMGSDPDKGERWVTFFGNPQRPDVAVDLVYDGRGHLLLVRPAVANPFHPGSDHLDADLLGSAEFASMVNSGRRALAGGVGMLGNMVRPAEGPNPLRHQAFVISGLGAKLADLARITRRYIELCGESPSTPDGRRRSVVDELAAEKKYSRRWVQDRLAEAEQYGLFERPGPRRKGGVLTDLGHEVLGAAEPAHE